MSVSADGNATETGAYDKTLSSADGSATVTFMGVPNSTQLRFYEVKAPAGYTAREYIGLYTDGSSNWFMWNREKGAWDNSAWKATSAGKAVYTGVTGSGVSTTLHVMDALAPPAVGKLEIYKVSARPEVTAGNACYSLQGAKYGVYRDAACTSLVGTLTTGSDGHAVSGDLTVDAYWVKETKASQGNALDASVYKVTVEAGKTARVNGATGTVKEQPQNDPVIVTVQKVDSKTGQKLPQGSASLEGAEFTVRYYAGQYTKSNLPSKAMRTWVIKTNKNGLAGLSDTYKVSGDDFYIINNVPSVPLGTVTIQETKAPAGYTLNSEVFLRNIKAEGSGLEHVSVDMTFQIPETALMGGISVQKADADTGLTTPQGKGSFKGAEFKIRNASGATVTVRGKAHADGGDIDALTLVTDDSGYAATGAHDLPFGAYAVREVKDPEGYLLTEGETMVTVSEDGVVVAATHP